MTRTACYCHYDAAGRLLYVGVTSDLGKRDKQHAAASAWFADVVRSTAAWFPDRASAIAEENRIIASAAPPFNRLGPRLAKCPPKESGVCTEINAIWPLTTDLAADLGVPYTTAASWMQRGRIPAKYDMDLVRCAKARGHQLTLEAVASARCANAALKRRAS